MSRPATSRLKVNPPLGSPPTLEWRAVGELGIDPDYQRSILAGPSQTLIRRIAQFWDWGLCQPLAIARRADGSLKVVDGQHRLEAARLRRDIPHLPCVITAYATAGDEAAAFVALNQQRRPLTALDLFKAALAASDTEALAVMAAITDAGLTLAGSTNNQQMKRAAVGNIGGLLRIYRRNGEPVVRAALQVLAKAYPDEILRYAGSIFPGIAAVVADELRLRSMPSEFIDDLVRLAASRSQIEWRKLFNASVGEAGGSQRDAAELVFRTMWRRRHLQFDEAQAAPAPTHLLPAEMAWCSQCDQRVSGAKADRCTSPFCSLKAKAA